MSDARLVVGDELDLLSGVWEDDGYLIEALSDVEVGAPQPLEVVLSSFLRDGEIVSKSGDGNRELSIPVRVRGTDLLATSSGEQRIKSFEGIQTTLAYTPPDGIGPTTVFPVWTSSFAQPYDDLAELRNERTYMWRFVCEPFSRSVDPVTVGSDFVADSEVIADDCESTTGWSVYGSGQSATITVDSTAGNFSTGTGAVKFVVEPYAFDAPDYVTSGSAWVDAKIRKSGLSIDASGGGYFVFRHRPEPGWAMDAYSGSFYLTSSGGGRQAATLVAATPMGDGFTKYALAIPDASTITVFEVDARQTKSPAPWGSAPANPGWWFDSIGLAAGASENQASRVFTVEGSARGEGSFEVSAAVGLGDVLLYTCPDLGDSFNPALRGWQSAGTSTADADAMNGSYVLGDAGVFEAPANIFRAGAYAVLARVRSSASTSIALDVDAQTVLDGTAIGQVYTAESGTITLPDTTGYHVVRVGVLDLPPHKVDSAADAVVRFTLAGNGTTRVDELMVFPLEDAALTWLACGSGTPGPAVASRVWVDGPSAQFPRGQILAGTQSDRSDARFIMPSSRGKHLLYPGPMFAYLLTSAAGGADMSVTYYPRWHTWAAS